MDDLPYFSVQAKKSHEQSAMFEASTPLDNDDIGAHDDFDADVDIHLILRICRTHLTF